MWTRQAGKVQASCVSRELRAGGRGLPGEAATHSQLQSRVEQVKGAEEEEREKQQIQNDMVLEVKEKERGKLGESWGI